MDIKVLDLRSDAALCTAPHVPPLSKLEDKIAIAENYKPEFCRAHPSVLEEGLNEQEKRIVGTHGVGP